MDEVSHPIQVLQGDITIVATDAIVNAANSSLMGGGGVDGAIHRVGGSSILEACKKIVAHQGECKTGEAVITTAGNLPCTFVIHTVGPVWEGGNHGEADKLANCYRNSLQLAIENSCSTIAFPNISTGIYGYPKKETAQIAVHTVIKFLATTDKIQKVLFVCFDDENFRIMKDELTRLLK
jgi:O-acetyl-ADP-ribose deacetylase (regulator of RNase III)